MPFMRSLCVRRSSWTRGACVLALSALALPVAGAQLPGLPVFQNAFANSGFTIAGNYGRSDDLTAYAAAGAWAPASARFQVSAGIGSLDADIGESDMAYGGRVSAGVAQFGGGSFGLAVFGGAGAASDAELLNLVAGAGLGYRRGLGNAGISVFVTPYYLNARQDVAGETFDTSLIRFGAGVDVSFYKRFGITVGLDAGGEADPGEPGPVGSTFGLAVSYAFGVR